ncbi:hypothetical protein CHS0354_003744 [Potamilus streckersoni]|uniref:Uncharacterized protein n=1 Tax=Potamilus streckersoni TaxID=2493646 RepID=A0AAE0SNC1_9BIVA|nr:hypothetical protein CHS0354_003744 [Potamilus streckersoni]
MINRTKLMNDIQANLTTSLPTTAEQLDNCLSSLLDKYAPATKCKVAVQKCSRWYSTAKRAKRLCLSTRITIHKQIYDAALYPTLVIHMIHNYPQNLFSVLRFTDGLQSNIPI